MAYIYLLCAIITSALLAISGTLFNKKNNWKEGLGGLYNLMAACGNWTTWLIIFCINPSYDLRIIPYAVAYGVSYAFFWVGLTGALQCGSSALTGFIKQIAFVFVAIWGFVFWNADPTVVMLAGIALIAIALFLCLVPIGKSAPKGTVKITGKWILYAVLILIGNAGCSILQRTQQMEFNKQHGSFLMVTATFFALIFCVLMCLKDDKREWKRVAISSGYFPLLAGSSSAVCNVFLIRLASTSLSTGIIYPALAIGGLTLTTLVSVAICKERLKISQWIGLAIGAVALVLLNL